MRHTFLIALLFLSIAGFAQNPATDFKYALKLSNLSSLTFSRIRDPQGNNIGGSYLRVFQPIPTFTYKTRKGNFNEIGLIRIALNSSRRYMRNAPLSNFAMAVSLTKNLVFFKSKDTRWVPMLGIGLSPSYSFAQFDPTNDPLRVKTRQQLGVELLVTPRINWFSKNRFFMDFGLPITMGSLNLTAVSMHPTNTSTGRDQSLLNFKLFSPSIMTQIGFGIKL